MNSSPRPQPTHRDESPIDLERIRQKLPSWLRRFVPSGGGSHEDHHGKGMFGFTVFLLSESIIFLSFSSPMLRSDLRLLIGYHQGLQGQNDRRL